jgi:hypothetical protein
MGCIHPSECHSLQAPLAWACEEVSDPACPIEEGKAIHALLSVTDVSLRGD